MFKGNYIAISGEEFGEVGLRENGEYVGDSKFEWMGRGQLRRARLARFME